MSANFCDKNPDQGSTNEHCFHVVSTRALPWKKGAGPKTARTLVTVLRCCWCGDETEEHRRDARVHGPKAWGQLR